MNQSLLCCPGYSDFKLKDERFFTDSEEIKKWKNDRVVSYFTL